MPATKRFKGMPDSGIGRLVTWAENDALVDHGEYRPSVESKSQVSKVSIPIELIDALRSQFCQLSGLSPMQVRKIPNNKIVMFFLFSELDNKLWADELKKAFDAKPELPFHKAMARQKSQAAPTTNRYADKSDRELLADVMDSVSSFRNWTNDKYEKSHKESFKQYSSLRALSFGALRAASWQIAEQILALPSILKQENEAGNQIAQNNNYQQMAAIANDDFIGNMADVLYQIGKSDVLRSQTKKNSN